MNEFIVVVYKEVGKLPEFKKIRNTREDFEKLVGGEFTTLDYEGFTIVYRKDNARLRPNIYLVTEFLSIGESIRGNIFLVNKDENGNFYSLNREEAIKYYSLLKRKAFHYEGFDESGRYIGNRKNRKKNREAKTIYPSSENADKSDENLKCDEKNNKQANIINQQQKGGKLILEKASAEDEVDLVSLDGEEVLKMILAMQSVIFKFLKDLIE